MAKSDPKSKQICVREPGALPSLKIRPRPGCRVKNFSGEKTSHQRITSSSRESTPCISFDEPSNNGEAADVSHLVLVSPQDLESSTQKPTAEGTPNTSGCASKILCGSIGTFSTIVFEDTSFDNDPSFVLVGPRSETRAANHPSTRSIFMTPCTPETDDTGSFAPKQEATSETDDMSDFKRVFSLGSFSPAEAPDDDDFPFVLVGPAHSRTPSPISSNSSELGKPGSLAPKIRTEFEASCIEGDISSTEQTAGEVSPWPCSPADTDRASIENHLGNLNSPFHMTPQDALKDDVPYLPSLQDKRIMSKSSSDSPCTTPEKPCARLRMKKNRFTNAFDFRTFSRTNHSTSDT